MCSYIQTTVFFSRDTCNNNFSIPLQHIFPFLPTDLSAVRSGLPASFSQDSTFVHIHVSPDAEEMQFQGMKPG